MKSGTALIANPPCWWSSWRGGRVGRGAEPVEQVGEEGHDVHAVVHLAVDLVGGVAELAGPAGDEHPLDRGAQVGDRSRPLAGIGLGARREDGDLRPLVGRPDAGRGEQVGDEGLPGTELAPGAQRADDDAGVAHGHGPVAQPLEHHRVAAGCQGALTAGDGGARPARGGLPARRRGTSTPR